MSTLCYLCGTPIDGTPSRDHAVPSTLITRTQPKARGYDYGGLLPTHPECNNRFGPETYVAKALDFLTALSDPHFLLERQHVNDPSIKILVVNSEILPDLTEGDLRFFKMIDVRDVDQEAWSSPEFFKNKERSNPIQRALFIALSVLTKSSAALLHKRHGISLPTLWRVYAFAYTGVNPDLTFDEIFGPSKPFDDRLHPWIHRLVDGNFFVIYKARGTLIYFLFAFVDSPMVSAVRSRFPETDHYYFEGSNLNALLSAGWRRI